MECSLPVGRSFWAWGLDSWRTVWHKVPKMKHEILNRSLDQILDTYEYCRNDAAVANGNGQRLYFGIRSWNAERNDIPPNYFNKITMEMAISSDVAAAGVGVTVTLIKYMVGVAWDIEAGLPSHTGHGLQGVDADDEASLGLYSLSTKGEVAAGARRTVIFKPAHWLTPKKLCVVNPHHPWEWAMDSALTVCVESKTDQPAWIFLHAVRFDLSRGDGLPDLVRYVLPRPRPRMEV